ncbi:MAG: hypothetical protein D6704_06645 [Nitrospirae bacterium]|nr:MAG: hypothetical protein D6704_06645 [Nitrospirota bacterium]
MGYPGTTTVTRIFICAILASLPITQARALHEVDHRFTVTGRVCGEDGQGLEGLKVIVKDTRASVGGSDVTDTDGRFKVVLHLHDENQGDPLLIRALEYEKHARVDFDPHDKTTERVLAVQLGGKCAPLPSRGWALYGVIGGSVAVALGLFRMMLKRKSKGGKGGKGGKGKTKAKS